VVISGVTYTSTGSNAPPATGPGAAGSSNAALPAAEKLRADMVTAMGSPNTKTNQQYDASFSSLLTNYAGVLQTRANLDRRLQDLYDDPPETSATGMSKTEMDAALYANILWTILATCIVYFIFMHL
jgi:hypothetical protein